MPRAPASADDPLAVHLLVRSPRPDELALLHDQIQATAPSPARTTSLHDAAGRITVRVTSPSEGAVPPASPSEGPARPWEGPARVTLPSEGPARVTSPGGAGNFDPRRGSDDGAAWPSDPEAEAEAPFTPAALLSGEPSAFRVLIAGLGAAAGPGPALAAGLERALVPPRPATWRLRTRSLALDRPLVMGIVNVTPDSFSDGGLFVEHPAAVAHGARLLEEGADILDVGGESTRPGAARVSPEEEERRVLPVVEGLAALGGTVSVDTTRARVAGRALEAGAEIVNDVSALRFDPALGGVAARAGAALVLMHMRGTPEIMQRDPRYQDVVGEVLELLAAALSKAERAGVDAARCAVDPGIGFGKRRADNEEILYRLSELAVLGRPLLVGVSRKGFLDPERHSGPAARQPETIAAACLAALEGAHILRVHDAGECRRALDLVRRIQAPPAEA